MNTKKILFGWVGIMVGIIAAPLLEFPYTIPAYILLFIGADLYGWGLHEEDKK